MTGRWWNLIGRGGSLRACLWRCILSLISLSVSLLPGHREVRDFALPHTLPQAQSDGTKQPWLKFPKLWSKVNLSSFELFFSGICHSNEKLKPFCFDPSKFICMCGIYSVILLFLTMDYFMNDYVFQARIMMKTNTVGSQSRAKNQDHHPYCWNPSWPNPTLLPKGNDPQWPTMDLCLFFLFLFLVIVFWTMWSSSSTCSEMYIKGIVLQIFFWKL
jgi:hypothetical protein